MLKEYNGKGYKFDTACEGKNIIIRVTPEAEDLAEIMEKCYNDKYLVTQICQNCDIPDEDGVQQTNEDTSDIIVMFDLKNASTEQKIEAIKYGLQTPTLQDPLLQLNIYNLVKSYNNMNEYFFSSTDVYFNSVEEILDVKLALGKEIKAFIRQLSIYFMSIFKSYNKFVFTPSDEHIVLPALYRNMILSSDLGTLSGIFTKTPEFSTKELVFVDDAYVYLTTLINKSQRGTDLVEEFLKSLEDENGEIENGTSN